jgi:transposase
MLGKRTSQSDIFSPEHRLRSKIGEKSFYVFLSDHRPEIFRDEDFSFLYCSDNGRKSVAPSLLATALLLQSYTGTSDQEATDRARFDQRWHVALGTQDDEEPFAKSTLCLFRNQLIVHEKAKLIFQKGLTYLSKQGFIKKHKITVALDTTPIFGRGAVEDTFNMLAEGLRQVMRVLSDIAAQSVEQYAQIHDFTRYSASSFKGTWTIDWDNSNERQVVLDSLVADSRRILLLASQQISILSPESQTAQNIVTASGLLRKLLAQDIREMTPQKAEIIQGVAQDRIISVHDPEMRHGCKSVSQRFDGYKGAIVVEADSQVIADVDVIPGNAHDSQNASSLIRQAEENLETSVEAMLGDTAYGTVEARLDARAHHYEVIAPVSHAPHTGRFTKEDFAINLQSDSVTCPNGQTTTLWYQQKRKTHRGTIFLYKGFRFSAEQCGHCPLRDRCLEEKTSYRSIAVHEHEELLQEAKTFQRTDEFRLRYRKRVVAEHRIARLVCLGIRQARYFGSKKTLFQLAMAAAVANLTMFAATQATNPLFFVLTLVFVILIVESPLRMSYRRPIFHPSV